MSDSRPIGVFDSGIGGLTVLRALRERMPRESYLYLGDTARVPYGTKGAATVVHFAGQALALLTERGIKTLVIACNTASALALDTLRACTALPLHGVIEPGVDAALRVTRGRVGVIGTLATIGSGRYPELLRRARPEVEVSSRACPLFVPLAEEGWLDHPVTRAVAEEYLSDLREAGVDTLILGCTHYPLLAPALAQVMGEGVTLVDSARVLAEAVESDLRATDALAPEDAEPGLHILVSDLPQRFSELSERFLAHPVGDVEVVELEAVSPSFPASPSSKPGDRP